MPTVTAPAIVATLTEVTLPEKIKSETDVNNVAREMILLNREVTKVDEEDAVIQARQVIADAEKRKQELAARGTALFEVYEPQITKFADKACKSAGVRAWETALIEVKFTFCPDIVIDALTGAAGQPAIPFIKKNCPTGVVEKPTISKKGFTDEFKQLCVGMKPAELAKNGLKITSTPHDSVKINLKHEDILK